MRRTVLTAVMAIALCGAGSGAGATDFMRETNTPECNRWVDSVYNALSERERIAQLFCPVVDPTKGEVSRNAIDRLVGREKVGGLLLRKGSIEDYAAMINRAGMQARVPVMMTFDGEWGLSMRIPGTPRFPYNMALGAISDTRLLEEYGAEVARECRLMGIHVDFAPVADINLNPDNPVIGRRSFGEDPARVASAVVAYSRGMEKGGVITTAKHFPGHGDTSTDSHKTLPVVDHSVEFMRENDLVPFIQYINAGMSGIMVGHLSVPSLDKTMMPASMSHAITTGLLQDELGFKGLVFTDALEMKGAVGGDDNNCVSAFKAGADILLSPTNPPADITALQEALKRGEIEASEVERRCRKVLAYKWALGLNNPPARIDAKNMSRQLNSDNALGLIERLTAASVTVTGNRGGVLPVSHGRSVALVNIGAGADNELAAVMKRHGEVTAFASNGTPLTTSQFEQIKKHDVVVAAIYNDKSTAVQQLEALSGHPSLVAVMFMTPYKAMAFKSQLQRCSAMVMMYDNNEEARRAAGDALYAGNAVSGRLPVSMPGVAALGEGVSYPATRISFSTPHVTSMPSWLTDSIDAIAKPAVADGAFPGLQVMVIKDGHVVADRCYGRVSNAGTAETVTASTLYDLASMSKILGTLPGIMLARQRGLLDLDTPIPAYIPELAGTDKSDITPRMLLLHESGMPASLNMNELMIDPDSYTGPLTRRRYSATHPIKISRNLYGNKSARLRRDITSATRSERFPYEAAVGIWVGPVTLDTIMHRIYDTELRSRTMRYSDLNFCLLMDIEQRLTGTKHDVLVGDNIFGPLGAYTCGYRPRSRYAATMSYAATENDRFLRRQTPSGYVHDELAAFSGGVQGNAGLFASATDVAKICTMYLNGGTYGGEQILNPAVVREFTTETSQTSRRGLGFDRPDTMDPDHSPVPEEVPASTYGHTGFTGTCCWVDPDNRLIYVFLSNRVNPTRDNVAWNRNKARSRIHALLYRALNGDTAD